MGSSGHELMAVRVWMLGGFRVSVGPREIAGDAWRLRKAASLVKLLALAPGHRLHREQAMELLWPTSAGKAASNNLRQVLYGARRILDTTPNVSCLGLEDEHLVLCPDGRLWVDVDAFEEAAATARRSGDPAAYRTAIDLYAGVLLPGDLQEEWSKEKRRALRQTFLSLLVELAGVHQDRAEHAPAVAALREATATEPTLEEAHVGLMRLYALSGKPERALAQYESLRDVLHRIAGTRPAGTTRRLRGEIAAGRFPPKAEPPRQEDPTSAGNHNLPAQRTSFVGREREMVEVRRLLSITRLLTLTGAGGSGKTRLALQVARKLVGVYPDGVWLVELAGLSEGDLVPQAVAGVLRVPERPDRPLAGVLSEALADKELLLILDNCEHLVDATARLVGPLLGSCPRLGVLATGREPLNIPGEVNWTVPLLSLPTDAEGEDGGGSTMDSLMGYESVRLFLDRARLRLPDFGLTEQNARAVARVCRKLDGMPLAIELATARMGALAVEQVTQRLDASLDILGGPDRTAAPRQQTLRATIDWSHDLLSEAEKELFGRLSVFAGGWALEAAEAVCSGGGVEREEVLDLLGALVDKSLVVAGTATGPAVRYRMLEPIRQYAKELLERGGWAEGVRDRHAAFFLALAEEAGPELEGPQQGSWMGRLEVEHDNLRAAISWVLDREAGDLGLRFGAALWRFWYTRGYLSEGARWLREVLAGGDKAASPVRVKALEGMGMLTQPRGDTGQAEATYEEMLELSRELGAMGDVATALNSLGFLAAVRGDNERARALLEENMAVLRGLDRRSTETKLKRYHVLGLLGQLALHEEGDPARAAALWEESLALAREVGDVDRIGTMQMVLGFAALVQGDYGRARSVCEEALALSDEDDSGTWWFVPEALVNRGLAELGQEEHGRAAASFSKALELARKMGIKASVLTSLEGLASLAGAMGEADRAARLWGAVEAERRASSIALSPIERALHEPHLASSRSLLGEEAWEEVLAAGRAMSPEEAAEYALSREEMDPSTSLTSLASAADEPMRGLTRREREVALLVARGLTNRQISVELSISERTSGNHVAKILRKLGLHSRAQIAARADLIAHIENPPET